MDNDHINLNRREQQTNTVEAMDTEDVPQEINITSSMDTVNTEDTAMLPLGGIKKNNIVLHDRNYKMSERELELATITSITSDYLNGDLLEGVVAAADTENIIVPPTIPLATQNENNSAVSTDAQMEDEEMRSEAVFRFRVENFTKLKESVLSPPCYVRNLPWKIMVLQRTSNPNDRNQAETRSMGFFLQCNADSDSSSWSCNAKAELRLLSFKPDQEPFVRQIKHLFYSKENDWGFSHFMAWNDFTDPEKGYIQDDAVVLEVHVIAEAPHGVFWDSKKHTGFVGLKNQGATCYMNSLLQTLYFTNYLRKAVYKMPTEADDSSKSVALALQRVFHDLQFSDKPVGTKKLTKSFGWETLDSFMQHDVQEFLRVLLDKVESKMKRTCAEGTVPLLFEGKMSSYIKCKNVDYTSTRLETFYDIQLNIKGKKNIYESFKDYIATEMLEGDNKYDAGEHGLQDAEKGVIFVKFPPVLHLHLMRFQYDPITDNSVKFNDRFDFYEHINLDKYLQKPEDTPADYTLHAVLVHSGDNHGGHYVVYINPTGDGKWCKFDDDVVSKCNKAEAIEHNYGGIDDDLSLNAKHCSNAYMLVYIRDSAMSMVLEQIDESDIPSELSDRLGEERRMEQVRRRERSESNTYISIHVLLEEYFEGHQTTDLFDVDKVHYRVFKLKKTQTIADLMNAFKEAFCTPIQHMRLWPLISRQNQLTRPAYFFFKDDPNKAIIQCAELQNPWTVFLELMQPDLQVPALQPFNKERDVLLFFKFYDPAMKRLNYCGLAYYYITQKVADLVPDLNRRLGWPLDTELTLYEEQGSNMVQKITNHNDTLEKLELIESDDVIIFEKRHCDGNLELATCEDYFKDLLYRVEVMFIDKTNPTDTGFTLELSQRMTYEQMAYAVGQKINVDPYTIQFFKCQNYKDIPGNAVRSSFEGPLKDLLVYSKPKSVKKIFYQLLPMNISELENKKQFKCLWLSPNMKEEKELVLYPNKSGTVKTLIEEAAKQVEFSEDGTHQLRMVAIQGCKISQGPREDQLLEFLHQHGDPSMSQQIIYRFEEIPRDEMHLAEDEMLIPVSHFYKNVLDVFGIPFFVKIKQGEPFGVWKDRIQNKLGIPDKEWEKYKFALVTMGRPEYINDDDAVINLSEFKQSSNQPGTAPLCYLGLEHVNKTQRRSRFNYLEKAIKIYN